MKKIFFVSLVLIAVINGKAQTTSPDLRNDPLFIDNVEKTDELANLIFIAQGKSSKKVIEVQKSVQDIANSKGLTDAEKAVKMNTVLGLPQNNGIEFYANQFQSNWKKIKSTYGDLLTTDYIKQETDALYKSESFQNRLSQKLYDDPCRRKTMYVLCSAAATTAAILCHAACLETIFGMFACFGLCATGQTYAIAVCYDTYCAPITAN